MWGCVWGKSTALLNRVQGRLAVRGRLEPSRSEGRVEVMIVVAVQHFRDSVRRLDARIVLAVQRTLSILHRPAVALAVRLEQVRTRAARPILDVVRETRVRVEHHLRIRIVDVARREVRYLRRQDARRPGTRHQLLIVPSIEDACLVDVGHPHAMMARELRNMGERERERKRERGRGRIGSISG